MLILTRRVGEDLIIDDGREEVTRVAVLGVKGNQVRIGIDAPRDVAVHREEIYNRIHDKQPTDQDNNRPSEKAGLSAEHDNSRHAVKPKKPAKRDNASLRKRLNIKASGDPSPQNT